MSDASDPPVIPPRGAALRRYTDARIALGRAGHSMPTAAHLALQLAHAQARDAVHLPFDAQATAAAVQALGLTTLALHSAAGSRAAYLQRPDLGRRLSNASIAALARWRERSGGDAPRFDVAFVIADGLSALAVHRHAAALIAAMLTRFDSAGAETWAVAPVAVVEQGRVAIGDEIGDALAARCVVMLIGERPGLSSPDSLGLYITWAPKPGLDDARRNCISNVRPAGLGVDAAAAKLHQLLIQARVRQITGVALKDEAEDAAASIAAGTHGSSDNFLLAP
jgi:ethanolamine ammonia-lyase small subunit